MTDRPPIRLRQPAGPAWFSENPQIVGIEITGRCQLRCRHCFNRSGPDNAYELPLDTISRILDEVTGWGVAEVRISGGEPTMHAQFHEVLTACATRRLGVSLNTNGLFAPDMLKFLRAAPVGCFLVSLDGLQASNDAIRGAGTFLRAVAAARALRQAGKRVILSCHVSAGNLGDVCGLAELAVAMGAGVKISPLRPIGRAFEELRGSFIGPKAFMDVVREVVALRQRFPGLELLTDFDILDGTPGTDCRRKSAAESCAAGRTMVNISYNGGIYPCAFFITPDRAFQAGSVHETTVSEAWRTSPVFAAFRAHQKSAACQVCRHYRRTCSGGCPAMAHFSSGFLDDLDPLCFAALADPPSR